MDNVQTMMYTGEEPWHGLGTRLEKEATAQEALKAAQMDWSVSKRPVFIKVGDKTIRIPDKFAVTRDDNNHPLGVVGKTYEPLQNKDAFSFFDAVVGEKSAIYHTAGALGQGEKLWILAKIPGDIRIEGTDDVTNKFLLLYNSHNGTTSVRMMITPIRVVCQNTLNMAMSAASDDHKAWVRHSTNIGDHVADVRDQLKLVNTWYERFGQQANALAQVQVKKAEIKPFLKAVGIEDKRPDGNDNPNFGKVVTLFEGGKGNDMKGIRGSWWAMVNGVTEYVDHERNTREGNYRSVDEARWASQIFGSGSRTKSKAWDKALEVVGASN